MHDTKCNAEEKEKQNINSFSAIQTTFEKALSVWRGVHPYLTQSSPYVMSQQVSACKQRERGTFREMEFTSVPRSHNVCSGWHLKAQRANLVNRKVQSYNTRQADLNADRVWQSRNIHHTLSTTIPAECVTFTHWWLSLYELGVITVPQLWLEMFTK